MPASLGQIIQNLLGGGSTPPPATGPGSNPGGGYANPGYAGYVPRPGMPQFRINPVVQPLPGGLSTSHLPTDSSGGGRGGGGEVNLGGSGRGGGGVDPNNIGYGQSASSLANAILAGSQAMHQPVNYTGNDRETNPRFYPGGGWQGRVVDGTVMRVAAPPVNFGLRPPTDRAALARFIYGSGARRNFLRGGGG